MTHPAIFPLILGALAVRCLADEANDVVVAGRAFVSAATAGDEKAVVRLMHAATPQEGVVRQSVGAIVVNAAAYEKAMRSTFGAKAAGQFGVASVDEPTAWEKASVRGGVIRLPIVSPPAELNLTPVGGQWKIGVATALGYLNAKGIGIAVPGDEPLRRLTQAAQAFREAADAIRAGRHVDAGSAAEAARQAVDDALQGRGFN